MSLFRMGGSRSVALYPQKKEAEKRHRRIWGDFFLRILNVIVIHCYRVAHGRDPNDGLVSCCNHKSNAGILDGL